MFGRARGCRMWWWQHRHHPPLWIHACMQVTVLYLQWKWKRGKMRKKRKRSNILLLRFYKLSPSLSLLIRNRRGFGDKFPVDTRTHIAHTKTAFLTSKYFMIPDLIRQYISLPSWQQAPSSRRRRQPFRTDSFICHTINSKTPSSSHHCSTGSFTNLYPQNPSVNVSELYKVCRSPDFEALKL